ncbi:MAG: alpha/beta hydrolase [Synechococcaceae cyanobacterium SM2_3_1]|nr:alpha/beta hydrolase [Synechococcaceae cyanobacterium SM2_3_1]
MKSKIFRKNLIGELSWKRMIRSLLLVYTFFGLYVYFRSDSMIFFPQPPSYSDTDDILKIPVTEEESISARYLINPASGYTLIYIHGNAEDLGHIEPILTQLYTLGFSIFAYDYRGYGTSDGRPSERNAYRDAEAVYNYLTAEKGIAPSRIIPYGRSVGGGSAVDLASRHPVGGLILESTFTSAFRVVLPFSILPFDKFTNLRKLSRIQCPLLVIHGEADEVIPVSHGKRLYDSATVPKLSLWVEGAGHNDLFWVVGDQYPTILHSFLDLVETHQ